MEQLTKKPVNFGSCGVGHLFKAYYGTGNIAIVAGKTGEIGKLSVNLIDEDVDENEFFVKLYSEGLIMNEPCFKTGLFEKIGKPINIRFGTFQKWKLKTKS